jgi:hypothetical protein
LGVEATVTDVASVPVEKKQDGSGMLRPENHGPDGLALESPIFSRASEGFHVIASIVIGAACRKKDLCLVGVEVIRGTYPHEQREAKQDGPKAKKDWP